MQEPDLVDKFVKEYSHLKRVLKCYAELQAMQIYVAMRGLTLPK